MVSPSPEPVSAEEGSELDSIQTSDRLVANPPVNEPMSGRDQKTIAYKPPSSLQSPEKLLNINTSLYSTTLSSFYGGSFVSFKFNQYFK